MFLILSKKITKEGFSRIITKCKLFHPLSAACWNDLSQFILFILSTDYRGLLIIYYYTSNRKNYDIENMPDKLYKLELGLQGESVDGQEAIEGSTIDQLYDEICEVYREYAQQCSLFFII